MVIPTSMDVVLDIQRMEWDEQGVGGFVWPLSRTEVWAMREAFLPQLVVAARGANGVQDEAAELLSIVLVYFAVEAMMAYQAHALCRRFSDLGHRLIVPPEWRLTSAIVEGRPPQLPAFSTLLRNGPPRGRLPHGWPFRGLAARARAFLRWNGLSPRRLWQAMNRGSHILSLSTKDWVNQYASTVSDTVKLTILSDWFAPLEPYPAADDHRSSDGDRTIETALKAVQAGFLAGNETLPNALAEYLRGYLAELMALAGRHFRSLLDHPNRLPRGLWTASAGCIWTRMLRHATRRFGGHVTGFAHGAGGGSPWKHGDVVLVELESCDVFVTYNERQAQALKEELRPEVHILPEAPDIIGLYERLPKATSPGSASRPPASSSRSRSSSIRTLMYPSTLYVGERLHLVPLLPDLVAVDWQARLLSQLRRLDYQVVQKPHPLSPTIHAPLRFRDQFGIQVETRLFEEVMESADALIFDYPLTTTFGAALGSSKPIVLIDLGLLPWRPGVREMVARRCRIVPAWFDEENRVQVDWEDLRSAIGDCRDLQDASFYESFYRRSDLIPTHP